MSGDQTVLQFTLGLTIVCVSVCMCDMCVVCVECVMHVWYVGRWYVVSVCVCVCVCMCEGVPCVDVVCV
jgi:hypothetical protein